MKVIFRKTHQPVLNWGARSQHDGKEWRKWYRRARPKSLMSSYLYEAWACRMMEIPSRREASSATGGVRKVLVTSGVSERIQKQKSQKLQKEKKRSDLKRAAARWLAFIYVIILLFFIRYEFQISEKLPKRPRLCRCIQGGVQGTSRIDLSRYTCHLYPTKKHFWIILCIFYLLDVLINI